MHDDTVAELVEQGRDGMTKGKKCSQLRYDRKVQNYERIRRNNW